jgi:HTH-type transcriptional regulator / antitoxin MqsA
MKCPACGAAELVHDTRDMPYTYKGDSTTIEAVTGDFCPACGFVTARQCWHSTSK